MTISDNQIRLASRLIDSLYTEAMILADEVRAYFDDAGRKERDALSPLMRVNFSCESLKVTTRLMHVISWLLTSKAMEAGQITADQAHASARRLGSAADTDAAVLKEMPETARNLIEASRDLYARVRRIDLDPMNPNPSSPARGLIDRLERAF